MKKYLLPLSLAALTALAPLSATAATQIVLDPSFEAGTPNPFWSEASDTFGTPLCDPASCGIAGARTGDWWAWFGGVVAPDTGLVSQPITFLNGTATLSFWFQNPISDTSSDIIEARIDGTPVWTYNAGGVHSGVLAYTQITVNLDAYADGGSHLLSFNSTVFGTSGFTNFFIDDVTVTTSAVPETGTWLMMGLGLAGLAAARRTR